ncbi:MAG: aminotransferase class V-fold PLP-dependent enzyme, partial [Planctomycetota bacterium]|nr:aminotransferase class V-fold PLP-dependent enzyme [Planctomycetota bacterium]
MWARKRFDLSWLDISYGLLQCARIGGSMDPRSVNQVWKDSRHPFTCLSVRTGFDLLLKSLDLPRGGEIIVSALTIEGMLTIIKEHGLVAVPADIETDTLAPSATHIESLITDKTQLVLIAHLFGSRINLDAIAEVTRKHQLLLVEDCAQQFEGMPEGRHDVADVSMYSFGPIKTATALGGAVFSVAREELANQLAELESQYPKRSRCFFFRRLLKYSCLKFISYKPTFAAFVGTMRLLGKDYNQLLKKSTRGFSGMNFFQLIRRRPSTPLLRLLARKLRCFNGKSLGIQRELGNYLQTTLREDSGHQTAGSNTPANHYWVYPVLVNDPCSV